MKRVSIAVAALIACLAIALIPATAAGKVKVKKFPATVTLAVSVVEPTGGYTPSGGSATFSGQVSSGGPAICRSARPVTITGIGGIFHATTNGTGGFSVA